MPLSEELSADYGSLRRVLDERAKVPGNRNILWVNGNFYNFQNDPEPRHRPLIEAVFGNYISDKALYTYHFGASKRNFLRSLQRENLTTEWQAWLQLNLIQAAIHEGIVSALPDDTPKDSTSVPLRHWHTMYFQAYTPERQEDRQLTLIGASHLAGAARLKDDYHLDLLIIDPVVGFPEEYAHRDEELLVKMAARRVASVLNQEEASRPEQIPPDESSILEAYPYLSFISAHKGIPTVVYTILNPFYDAWLKDFCKKQLGVKEFLYEQETGCHPNAEARLIRESIAA